MEKSNVRKNILYLFLTSFQASKHYLSQCTNLCSLSPLWDSAATAWGTPSGTRWPCWVSGLAMRQAHPRGTCLDWGRPTVLPTLWWTRHVIAKIIRPKLPSNEWNPSWLWPHGGLVPHFWRTSWTIILERIILLSRCIILAINFTGILSKFHIRKQWWNCVL